MKHTKVKGWIKVLIFLLILCGLIFTYGRYIEPKLFKVKEYNIIDRNIPNSFYGFKIVEISDIKYKTTINKKELNKIVNEINLIKPDIVIFNGDLFDKNIEYTEKDYKDLKKALKNINYNVGKFAIKGDNDLKIKKWEEVISYSDFIDLNDKYELIYNDDITPILLIGVSSNYKKNHIKNALNSIHSKIQEKINYSILILHEPDFIKDIDYSKYNLILAGHSLNGKIKIPYIGGISKNKYSKIYYDEYYDLENTKLYISNGIGTDKPRFRLFNTPSISLFRLRNK